MGARGGLTRGTQPRPSRTQARTHPPLLVLLPVHDDHVPLGEGQLVRVVGHAVVKGFDPLGLQLGLRGGEGGQRSLWQGGARSWAGNGAHRCQVRRGGPGELRGCGDSEEGPEGKGKRSQPGRELGTRRPAPAVRGADLGLR